MKGFEFKVGTDHIFDCSDPDNPVEVEAIELNRTRNGIHWFAMTLTPEEWREVIPAIEAKIEEVKND